MPQIATDGQTPIAVRSALRSIAAARDDSGLVFTHQGSARVWPLVADHPLDFHFNPSTMGGVIPMALGMALAQPDRQVIALVGDGSLLMNLGSLVTATAAECRNLKVILLDNRRYEVTGGQHTVASRLEIRYDDLARSIGFRTADAYSDADTWQARAGDFLAQDGPSFCWLKVAPALPDDMQTVQEPMAQQLERIQKQLQS